MSRRRALDPTKAISITLPISMLDALDDKLTRTQSRSAWIASAIQSSLDYQPVNIPTGQLMAMLHARVNGFDGQAEDKTLATLLLDRLTS